MLISNKMKFLAAITLSVLSLSAHGEKIALVGGTVINPADGKVLPNATVVIDAATRNVLAARRQSLTCRRL